ncbi:MAG TPA: ParB N-terminal domain-containing protein [Anaeromyxobacter sp.]|nr:ParB N-terminal domain-containing protein [Anaeromyxobacter sp.]
MELEPRTTAPAHATGAVEFVALADVSDDATFRLRDEGDVGALAASLGRLGQLVPVELRPLPGAAPEGPRWQIVAGFRRVAAARLLGRERVLARVHQVLGDEDAWSLALAPALVGEPLLATELLALGERLEAEKVAPWAAEAVGEAVARAPVDPKLRDRFRQFLERGADAAAREEPAAGEGGEGEREGGEAAVEVTPEELAEDLARRMFEVNQDLALAWSSWAELPAEGRRMILAQARYVAEILEHLERLEREER